jgi:hypothetical protein
MRSGVRDTTKLSWKDLPFELRDELTGKLHNLYDARGDEPAFDSLAVDKQQALLLLLKRMQQKQLWPAVRRIENVYGLGGVGMQFNAWPVLESTLARRRDFTRLFARHSQTSGGFYERGRPRAALHFIFQKCDPVKWYVHFDLYNPVFSLSSLALHMRYEVLGKLTPDWRQIRASLQP